MHKTSGGEAKVCITASCRLSALRDALMSPQWKGGGIRRRLGAADRHSLFQCDRQSCWTPVCFNYLSNAILPPLSEWSSRKAQIIVSSFYLPAANSCTQLTHLYRDKLDANVYHNDSNSAYDASLPTLIAAHFPRIYRAERGGRTS